MACRADALGGTGVKGGLSRNPVLLALVLGVLGFILLPLAVAVSIGFSSSPFLKFPPPGLSLKWIAKFLGDAGFLEALWVSLKLATIVTAIGVAMALMLAFGLMHLRSPRWRNVVNGFILAPLVFPVVLLAVGLLLLLARVDLLGSSFGLIAAHLIIVVPLCLVTMRAAIDRLNPEIAAAAASLGAGPLRAFISVTLPQIWASVAGAAILSFLFSLNDVTFAAFLGGPDTQTLPLKLFSYVRYRLDPLVGAVSAVFVFSTLALIVLADRMVGFDRILGLRREE